MIKNTILIVVSLVTLMTTPLMSQNYTLKGNTNQINWTGYAEAGGFSQTGVITIQSSEVVMDKDGKLSGKVIIDMKSLFSESKKLTKHLKDKDFFDVKKYPIAILQFEQATNGEVAGELLLKGVTGEVRFQPKIEQKGNQLTVTGEATIDRTLYGIKYNSSSYFQDLGSYAIKNDFDIGFELVYVVE
ncbi:MAG: YceI family protein [Bacteroidota bacterium]